MICPLIVDGVSYVSCAEAQCAWWVPERGQCLMLVIATSLASIKHTENEDEHDELISSFLCN